MITVKSSTPKLKKIFLERYPNCKKAITFYEEATHSTFEWEYLTRVRLEKFVSYMLAHVSPGTARNYAGKVKAIFSLYSDVIAIPKDYWTVLKVRLVKSQNTYLEIPEIKKLIAYEPANRAEHIVKNTFLLGCLTGTRHSDCINLTSANVTKTCIQYMSEKTNTDTKVPLSQAAKRIIKENEELNASESKYSLSYFNEVLRRICKNVGIKTNLTLYQAGKLQTAPKYEFISSHTARRTFATNLYKHGTDIFTISKLCGHSSIEMTKNYICCEARITKETLKYFKQFD